MDISKINKKVKNTPDNIKEELSKIVGSTDEKITNLATNVSNEINEKINSIDLSPLATKIEVNELKTIVESNNTTLTNSVSTANTEVNKKIDKTGGQFEGVIQAQANTEYTTAQMRNVILSTEDPNVSLGNNGDIWIKYK